MAYRDYVERESGIVYKRVKHMSPLVLGFIQARMGSSRLPGKVMASLAGKPILQHVVERVRKAEMVEDVVVCTSNKSADEEIKEWCSDNGVMCVRGSENDVLGRFCDGIRIYKPDYIVRITADDPLLEAEIITRVVGNGIADCDLDYCSNVLERSWPRGLDCELVKASSLLRVEELAHTAEDREHVTLFIRRHGEMFKLRSVVAPPEERWPELRLCVDSGDDLRFITEIWSKLGGDDQRLCLKEVLSLLKGSPELLEINRETEQTKIFGIEY